MIWKGDVLFLNLGNSTYSGGALPRTKVTWKFIKYSDPMFPFHFYECQMAAWDTESSGFAVSKSEIEALQKSFAEAWERICFLKLQTSNIKFSHVVSSNGFAAGANSKMSNENAKNELIEREILLNAWTLQIGWQKVSIYSAEVLLMKLGLFLKGWKLDFFEVKSNLGSMFAGLLRHQQLGAIFDSAYAPSKSKAIDRILLSLAKNSYFQKKSNLQILMENESPESHREFYANPKHLEAFSFLDNNQSITANIYLQKPEEIEIQIISEAEEFPAVSFAFHSKWQKLSWGKSSVSGRNRWPHPLA